MFKHSSLRLSGSKYTRKNIAPRNYWTKPENLRIFFDHLGQKVGVSYLDDWYTKISTLLVKQHGGRGLLVHFQSPLAALAAAYPEHNWIPWKFHCVPKGYWSDQSNQTKFFDDLGKKLGVKTMEDWYLALSGDALTQHGGQGLLFRHHNSPLSALMTAYPDYKWIPWKFRCSPMGFWTKRENRKMFFEDLAKKLNIKTDDDWYQHLSYKAIVEHGGAGMLRLYNGSPIAALESVYPEHNWIPWKFRATPTGFWKDTSNQRKFFDDLGAKIGIQTLDDWYQKLSGELIVEHDGIGLLVHHRRSPSAALMAAYPEHNWIPWKFARVSVGIWKSKENVLKFLSEMSEKLSIKTLDDWYRVELKQLYHFGGYTLVTTHNGLYKLLRHYYPQYPWDPKKFQQQQKKAQRWLAVTLKKMFPNEEIMEDYVHPEAVFPSSNRPMQLDVFIPSKSLAFEYQGEQHFREISIFSRARNYQQRDEEKRALCVSNNIKLVEVPYWWNRTQESLEQFMTRA